MTTQLTGTKFPGHWQWAADERRLIHSIYQQIDQEFPVGKNLLINMTWFGPQFPNGEYERALEIGQQEQFDRVFLLAGPEPAFLTRAQVDDLQEAFGVDQFYKLGHFDGEYEFSLVASDYLPNYFKTYTEQEVVLTEPNYLFMCYNRKPREHRVALVQKLIASGLDQRGIVTLGKNDPVYSKSDTNNLEILLGEEPDDYAKEGNWNNPMNFGIPHDIHSLGNMNYWQQHFINLVSETEFLPWDNTFLSEKTFKPMLGLRPFILNGQTQIYSWLRNRGFRTFNHYWSHIDLESAKEFQVHDRIIDVLNFLSEKTASELKSMYADMLPDLRHNKERFWEFGREQKYKMDHLFECHNITY